VGILEKREALVSARLVGEKRHEKDIEKVFLFY
jgi:hypothetical protein